MPVGGYTPGQNINLELNVNNQSSQPVTEFIVQLLKVSEINVNSLCNLF